MDIRALDHVNLGTRTIPKKSRSNNFTRIPSDKIRRNYIAETNTTFLNNSFEPDCDCRPENLGSTFGFERFDDSKELCYNTTKFNQTGYRENSESCVISDVKVLEPNFFESNTCMKFFLVRGI